MARSALGESWQHLYRSKKWRALRAKKLARHPYCQCPHHQGKDTSAKATVVDHHLAHKGDMRLFWNEQNLRSMTKACHDGPKQSLERGGSGYYKGCDASGMPLSRDHHWSRA